MTTAIYVSTEEVSWFVYVLAALRTYTVMLKIVLFHSLIRLAML
jgi:hypothetical protein